MENGLEVKRKRNKEKNHKQENKNEYLLLSWKRNKDISLEGNEEKVKKKEKDYLSSKKKSPLYDRSIFLNFRN